MSATNSWNTASTASTSLNLGRIFTRSGTDQDLTKAADGLGNHFIDSNAVQGAPVSATQTSPIAGTALNVSSGSLASQNHASSVSLGRASGAGSIPPRIDGYAKKVEDYKPGYPRYGALISTHSPYLICRRFDRLRARMLLLKQDKLTMLEEKLEEIDDKEPFDLFLGKSRLDGNDERKAILQEIEVALADYDQFVERTRQMQNLQHAKSRDMQSLRNWVEGTGSIAREETEYLWYERELVTLAPVEDNAVKQLEAWVEDTLMKVYYTFRKTSQSSHLNLSTDPNVFHYTGTFIRRLARALLLCLITVLLLVPVVICTFVTNMLWRILIIMVSTIVYLSVLSLLTKSKSMELVVAGATYTTILIAFIASTNN